LMRSEIEVLSPRTLEEALTLLQQHQKDIRIIAGGSDIIVQLRDGAIKTKKLLNILPVKNLRFVEEKKGRVRIGSLSTYGDIVRSQHTRKHAWILVETYERIGPFGAKGVGEIGIVPVGSAVANAIYNATGTRVYTLPATPENVYNALRTKVP
jgi:xanthine dehydrogenase FAD-binding subunit